MYHHMHHAMQTVQSMLLLAVCARSPLAGLAPGQFVFMLNNGPETDTGVYNGNNNGVGLTVHTAQVGGILNALVPMHQPHSIFILF